MAEDFLEIIYEDAKVLCKLREVVKSARERNHHQAILDLEEIMPLLSKMCTQYIKQDVEKGKSLWESIKKICPEKDLLFLTDIVESELLPQLEGYMKQWGTIRQEDGESFLFESSASGFLTMKDLQQDAYFHSTIDPMWEAEQLIEDIYDPQKETWALLGCGLGYHAYQLYEISKGSVKIHIFEKNPKIVEYARMYGVLDWIPEENLVINTDDDILSFLHFLDEQEEKTGVHFFYPELRLLNEEDIDVIWELHIQLNTNRHMQLYNQINFRKNISSGCKLINQFDASKVKEECVIVAAGPSLDESLEFLRKSQGKRTLIAVGTVFKKLIDAEIVPQLVVIVDPQMRTANQLEGIEDQEIPMLLSMEACWKFADIYAGEKYLIPLAGKKNVAEYAKQHDLGLWPAGGTVTYTALDAAIKFGAKKIFLVGADMAFPGGMTHATETMDCKKRSVENLIATEGVGGNEVYTDYPFRIFRDCIEGRIEQSPQVEFYNLSKVGARIKGTIEVDIDTL